MPLPLRTPEEMYDYCVKNDCRWGMTRIWATKHFELIVNSLNPDEKVCAVFIGLQMALMFQTLRLSLMIKPKNLFIAQRILRHPTRRALSREIKRKRPI